MKAGYSKRFHCAAERFASAQEGNTTGQNSTNEEYTLTTTTVKSGSVNQQASVPIKGAPVERCLRPGQEPLALNGKRIAATPAADNVPARQSPAQTMPRQIHGGMFNVKVGPAYPADVATKQGAHNATVQVIDSQGNILALWREVNGECVKPQKPMSITLLRQSTHVEQKALTRILLKDEILLITSQLPPCKSCQGAMRAATLGNKARIVYQWMEIRNSDVIMQISVWQGGKKVQTQIG